MSTLFFLKLIVACAVSTLVSRILYAGISHSTGDDNNIFGTISEFFFICTLAAIVITAWSWVFN